MKTLDIDAVHAFVVTADLKSFTRAAEVLDTTQAAVSVRIKRLEDSLGRRLLERTPRLVCLSADGQAFLDAARALVGAHNGALGAFDTRRRRLVLGISQHIVGAELPLLLKRMSDADPALLLEVRIASSLALLADFDRGAFDAVVVLRHDQRRLDGDVILQEAFGWMARADFAQRAGEPLRLATQAAPCSVRQMAVGALDAAGIAWTEVFVGEGVATIGAALSAGLAVAALGRRVAPAGTVDVGPRFGLPPLPARDVVLHSNLTDAQGRATLRALAGAIRSLA